MKMRYLTILLAVVFPANVMALSIISDPFAAAPAPQPTECVYIHTDAAPPANTALVASPVEVVASAVRCNMNIDSVTKGVPHDFMVFARNATLTSTQVPFTFTIPLPPVLPPPANIRCDPVCQVVP